MNLTDAQVLILVLLAPWLVLSLVAVLLLAIRGDQP